MLAVCPAALVIADRAHHWLTAGERLNRIHERVAQLAVLVLEVIGPVARVDDAVEAWASGRLEIVDERRDGGRLVAKLVYG